MSRSLPLFVTLASDCRQLVLDCRDGVPSLLYFGPSLAESTTPQMLAMLATRQEAQGRTEFDPPVSLAAESGEGFGGTPGVQLHRDGRAFGVATRLTHVDQSSPLEAVLTAACPASGIALVYTLSLDAISGVLCASTRLVNNGDGVVTLAHCTAPVLVVPEHLDQITGFEGRWSLEFQRQTVPRVLGLHVRENRSGRTSHDTFPGMLVHGEQTCETSGEVLGIHLGWSGNHRLTVESLPDGRAFAAAGELLLPGEVRLAPGEHYTSPMVFAGFSDQGFGDLSRRFHRFVRTRLTDPRMDGKLKRVHFNTWEAMYFDLSLDRLKSLADAAASVGVERFVLDDGWFGQRKSDRAGLGDWFVARDVFPDGLGPLIEHVHGLGMEFGLWFEPEMVNPDSDLYRAHPDWVLSLDPLPRLMARHQLVLDLTRPEVTDYLFERIDALLSEYEIAYIKWDMNRDLSQPGDGHDRPAVHRQTHAFYALLARIRAAHPRVEIESCSSGGARADFGVLAHTDRIWTSDSNDALDRLLIQSGASVFFPPEVMGAHVGPRDCHITGRTLSLALRCAVAMFGDMGIEANLLEMSDEARAELRAGVALHKAHRELLFRGDWHRLDVASNETAFGVVASDRREALFGYALMASQRRSAPGRLRLVGLDPAATYRVARVWPKSLRQHSRSALDEIDGSVFTGDSLMRAGAQLPILHPETMLVLHLTRQ